ncbi:DUF167 domain-containing protein [Erythrobacter mangrovi]|uniref:UPF0235 protein HQR01_05825 n=1 Tax=Erythrobacter mangrovi TaxID=2739433 RepID=A0A7D4BU78_9SPHN|nr:DUF167 domain-containing protein [Erythrobacter mangrovi]QKG70927.1 DUF167 domain-containing protein [Erythrobacter mangrovi]
MKRSRAELPDADALRALIDKAGWLAVRATPGARSEALRIEDGRVLVKVRAKPQDGAANEAVIRLVAQALNLAPSRVELLRGATSREKLLRIAT